MSENNTLNLTEFKPTPIIKKLTKSKSIEGLNIVSEQPAEETVKKARGRKCKYENEEERKEARRKQQREYRLRKKHELELLRKYVEEHFREEEDNEDDSSENHEGSEGGLIEADDGNVDGDSPNSSSLHEMSEEK